MISPFNYKECLNFKEETCVKSSAQVRILGIVRGHEYLNPNLRLLHAIFIAS